MSIERVDPVVRTVTLTFSGDDLTRLDWLCRRNVSVPAAITSDPAERESYEQFLDRIRTLLEGKS